jgi:hypothetical protein
MDMADKQAEKVTGGSVTTPPEAAPPEPETLADKRARVERERAEIIAAQKQERAAKRAAVKEQREKELLARKAKRVACEQAVGIASRALDAARANWREAVKSENATRQLLGLPCREKKGAGPTEEIVT